MKFYIKVHNSEGRSIVAVCDEYLVGKTFGDGDLKLEVSERFYKGELKSKEDTEKILNEASNVNLVGKEIIKLCLRLDLIDKENIVKFQGVPYAIILRL